MFARSLFLVCWSFTLMASERLIGLTPEEADGVRVVLAEAKALGLPDLTGAKVAAGFLPPWSTAWRGLHLRLADGSWLVDGVERQPASNEPERITWLRPEGSVDSVVRNLPEDLARRALTNGGLGTVWSSYRGDARLAALVWWLGGADDLGFTVVSSVLLEQARGRDLACVLRVNSLQPMETSPPDSATGLALPTIPQGIRRAMARWFRGRLAAATTPQEATALAEAMRRILDPADRPLWEPQIRLLRGRAEVLMTATDLAQRLAQWEQPRDRRSGNPALSEGIPDLIALLTDDRPARWLDREHLPRTVGDVALVALSRRWGFDVRWLVCRDPAVVACQPPPPAEYRHMIPTWTVWGDPWYWDGVVWTNARRAVVTAALQRWWDRLPVGGSPRGAVMEVLPLGAWSPFLHTLSVGELADPALGAALAERLTTLPPVPADLHLASSLVEAIQQAAQVQPTNQRLTTALVQGLGAPWKPVLLALRAELNGDGTDLDALVQSAFAGQIAAPTPDQWDQAATAWALVARWCLRPTPERLAALVAAQAGDLTLPYQPWLTYRLGSTDWHDYLARPIPWVRSAPRLPTALAVAALGDRRLMPAALRDGVLAWTKGRNGPFFADAGRLPADARLCDWVAGRLLASNGLLRGQTPHTSTSFFAASEEVRDGIIADLRRQLVTPKADPQGSGTPLEVDPPTGVTNF